MSEIQKQVADNEIISKEALQMSNYNQQYSRKFNIKIMNYPENKDEKIRDIFVKDIVKDKLNVKVDSSEIQAIHRIPGKIGEARPVIVKLVNSEVKYRIMRAKKNLPKKETVNIKSNEQSYLILVFLVFRTTQTSDQKPPDYGVF
jgi:hypothetical protein